MCMGTVCQFCGQRVAAVVATAAVMRVSVLRTACRCCGGTATAMHVSVLRTACLCCGGHSRSDACVSLRTACLHCGGHSLSDACVSLWTACLRCGGHSHSDECVSSADSVSPLWWPQPQGCDRSVPLSCALKMHRKDGILCIFHHKRKISLHIQSGIIFEVSQV